MAQVAELVFVVDEVVGGEEGEAGGRMAVGLREASRRQRAALLGL